MTSFNPKNWSVVCWLLLLLWLFLSAAMNAPFEPNPAERQRGRKSIDLGDPGFRPNYETAVYDQTLDIGWPFSYLEIAIGKPLPSVYRYKPVMAVLNFIAIISTLVSLVYAVQNWILRFSIRIMLGGVTLVAVLVVIGQAVFSGNHYVLQSIFMTTVYFSPIVAALAYFASYRIRLRNEDAG